jgi:hypothetical protein
MLSTAIKAQPDTSAHLEPKFADIAAAMSFTELDAMIASGIDAYKSDNVAMLKNKERLRVFVTEMRERLSAQGKRTDLPDTPKGLTWQKWVESKKKAIGSLSTIKRLLADPKEKSKKTLWKELIDRLEILLPTVEDGNEHVIVHKLETAILIHEIRIRLPLEVKLQHLLLELGLGKDVADDAGEAPAVLAVDELGDSIPNVLLLIATAVRSIVQGTCVGNHVQCPILVVGKRFTCLVVLKVIVKLEVWVELPCWTRRSLTLRSTHKGPVFAEPFHELRIKALGESLLIARLVDAITFAGLTRPHGRRSRNGIRSVQFEFKNLL